MHLGLERVVSPIAAHYHGSGSEEVLLLLCISRKMFSEIDQKKQSILARRAAQFNGNANSNFSRENYAIGDIQMRRGEERAAARVNMH